MGQSPLVTEHIDAGLELARRFNDTYPVRAAFWLKESEDSPWYFHLASDRINDTNFDLAYREVVRLVGQGSRMWLDSSDVKVLGMSHPLAKAVFEITQKYPGILPTRLRNRLPPAGPSIEEAYIYPNPLPVPVAT
jgi:hypothetical protein